MFDPKDAARKLMIRNAREQAELEARRSLAQAEGRRLAQRILKEIPGTKKRHISCGLPSSLKIALTKPHGTRTFLTA